MIRSIFVFGIFLAVSQRSFVSTIPISDAERRNIGVKDEKHVQELENLKHSLGRTLSMMRTQTDFYKDVDGKEEAHATNAEEIQQNGQLVAKLFQRMDTDPDAPDKNDQTRARVRTELEVPSEGLHHVEEQQLPKERKRQSSNQDQQMESQNNEDRTSNSPSEETQHYTPLDMAEYVFWTGDEKSVSLAIEEFLQEGIMTREEAISFLQKIKHDLDYMKDHYSRYGPNFHEQSQDSIKEKGNQMKVYQNSRKSATQQKRTMREQVQSELNHLRQLQETYKKDKADEIALYFDGSNQGKNAVLDVESYQELLDRLKLADFLYTEYSLEEVIYQLAKVIFTQSLSARSLDAQNALSKFINFLEREAKEGRISISLEKKVLDVLVSALSDTINEHPEMINLRQEIFQNNGEVAAGQDVLKQTHQYPPETRTLNQLQIGPYVAAKEQESIQSNKNNIQMKKRKMLLPNPYAIARE